MSEISSNSCPQCGAALPSAATKGLCPRCLMAEAMVPTQDEPTGPHGTKIVAPPPGIEAVRAAFPQLEVIELIGRGGMGVVYKARQKSLDRFVALKLLAPERVTDAHFAERFTREAQALARLNHPNIVTIYDFGVATAPELPSAISRVPLYFLLMEFVDGVNLRQAMKAGRFTPEQALAVVPPVCEALQYAHEHGIVHRDIKPENLLLDKDGRVKIADFGIAKMLGSSPADSGHPQVKGEAIGGLPESAGAQFDSLAASAAGTPQYMAPEQKEHRRTDHRADIYSLGVVLYELLTGELPADRLQPPSRKVQIDVRLDEIVLRALEQKPELRFQTAADLRTQVETMVGTPPLIHGNQAVPTDTEVISPRLLKTGTCTITTPEKLATFTGQFFHYRNNRGQLILDDRQVTYSRAGANTVIPLAAIRDLSIGQYPRMMNLANLDFLSVTYEEGGQRKQVLLSPMEGFFALPGTWDARVAEWATAIREAATAATGRAPATTPSEQLGVPGSHVVLLKMFLMALVPLGVLLTFVNVQSSPLASRHNIGFMSLFIFGMAAVGLFLLFLQRRQVKSPPGSARTLSPWRIVSGLLGFSVVLLGLAVLVYMIPSKSASGVSGFVCVPVGVSNNVVIVDVNAEVASGGAEVQAALDGPRILPAIEAGLAETFFPPFAGTFVKPTPYVGNRPWRIWKAGPQTWRLGFALPDAALAKEAFENLRPIGPLPAKPRRTFAGTLFEVGQPGGAKYRASLNVTPPVGANDPNWVSTSVTSTYNESGVNMNWQVEASQPGTVLLRQEGGRSTASLKRDPKSKLHLTSVSLELTKVGTNRVLFVSRIGGVTARQELSGSFRDLSAELLRYVNMSTKTVRGAEIELCQFQGKPITVQVPVLTTVTTPATVKEVSWSSPIVGVGIIGLCVIGGIVLIIMLVRKGGTVGKVVALLCVVPMLLLAVVLVGYLSMRAGRVTDAKLRAVSAARVEAQAKAGLLPSTTPTIQPALAATRTFPLRHKLGSDMVDDLRQILLGRPGHEAKASADNQQVVITAPSDALARAQTFITVTDWPDKIARGANYEYPRQTVLRAARSFFHACALADETEAISNQVSLFVLAQLKGETKSEHYFKYNTGGVPDPEWEKSLRADWPGKQEAIQRLVREWNRYPLKRITEDSGVAMGFGVKHFCSVAFEGAPKEFYQVTIEPERTKPRNDGEGPFYFSSLPPWWKDAPGEANPPPPQPVAAPLIRREVKQPNPGGKNLDQP